MVTVHNTEFRNLIPRRNINLIGYFLQSQQNRTNKHTQ